MELGEAIKIYNELKKNKEKVKNINADFFFKFAETILQALENLQNKNSKLIEKNIKYEQTLENLQKETIWKMKIENKKELIKMQEDYDYKTTYTSKQVKDLLQELLEGN